MKTQITGMGWVNTAGAGQGRRAVFSAGSGGSLPRLRGKEIFQDDLPRYGRMDHYSRLGITAIAFALKDAGLYEWVEKREIAMIASTVFGCLGTDEDYLDTVIPEGGRFASPNLFAYTLPNTFLGEAAVRFGLTGVSFVINEPRLSGMAGLSMAMDIVGHHGDGAVLAGVCDAGAPPSLAVKDPSATGALFFVLQEGSGGHSSPYGDLTRDEMKEILFEGKKVKDLNRLAVLCTEIIHGGGRAI